MSFTWGEYLNLAKGLLGVPGPTPDGEALSRTAISRAYYSVYHRSLSFITKIDGLPDDRANLHDQIKKWYFQKGEEDENIREMGVIYSRLKNARRDADYIENSTKCNSYKAVQVITDSEEIIRRIDEFASQTSS